MTQKPASSNKVPIYAALVLIIVVVVGFIVVILANQSGDTAGVEPLSAESYRARVDALLAIAQPENVGSALDKYACIACHRAGSTIAPVWEGIAERAATRRPPMPADAYIYESIVHPEAFLVEGYNDLMPHDFGARASDQELADMIAYLLTPDAH
ncbi:MAG: c-type cytochrome [Chloroflexota bacterium]